MSLASANFEAVAKMDKSSLSKSQIANLEFQIANNKLEGFGGFTSKQDLIAAVQAMGKSDDADIRGYVMNILFHLDKEVGYSFLERCLQDPDECIRSGAIELLGGYGQRVTPLLIPILNSDPIPNVRSSAATMLGYVGTLEAIPALKWAQQNDHARNYEETRVSTEAEYAITAIEARHKRDLKGTGRTGPI
jgi:HEAT repeat protein